MCVKEEIVELASFVPDLFVCLFCLVNTVRDQICKPKNKNKKYPSSKNTKKQNNQPNDLNLLDKKQNKAEIFVQH